MLSMRVCHARLLQLQCQMAVLRLSALEQKRATALAVLLLQQDLCLNMKSLLSHVVVPKLSAQPFQKVVDVSIMSLCARAHDLFEWTCAWRSIVISRRDRAQSFFTVCQKVVLSRTV